MEETHDESLPVNYRQFLEPLDAMPFEDLLAAAKNVEALLGSDGWVFVHELVERVEKRTMDRLVRDATSRKPPDGVEQAAVLGMVRGLRVARDAADTVILMARERDREEQEAAAEAGREKEQTHG